MYIIDHISLDKVVPNLTFHLISHLLGSSDFTFDQTTVAGFTTRIVSKISECEMEYMVLIAGIQRVPTIP